MLIECLVKRDAPIIVPIGNQKYEFKPDARGRRVAEVWLEKHIECFLAVSHLYREVKDEAEAPLFAPKAENLVNGIDGAAPPVSEADMPAADTAALRAEYERLTGKKCWRGWNAAMLRQKIAEAVAPGA